ncbi:MAG: alpha/beta fold hydrolase [Candidatus Obscuribacterales bacterium]|nr:alpha/beta fold hydrolase [Candidatus Obscuribacterales bacterium]
MTKNLAAMALALMLGLAALKVQAAPTYLAQNKTSQQLNLPISEWIDANKKRKGTIIAVHGLTLYGDAWSDMAKHLAANGYRVFALDQRGFGRWQKDGAKYGGNNKIEISQSQQDLLDLTTTVRQATPKQKLYLLGESLGSNMILTLISEHPELADGAILGSPCYKRRAHPAPLHWTEDFAKQMIKPNKAIDLSPYSEPYLSNDPVVAKDCDQDPMLNRKMTPAELIKVDVLCNRSWNDAKTLPTNFPLLIVAGDKDAMFKSTDLKKGIEKFGSTNISLNLLAGRGHLLMEHQKVIPKVASLIDTWLSKNTGSLLATNTSATGTTGKTAPVASP